MVLDLIFFALIVVFAVLGFVFGFFRTLFSFFGWFISLLMAYLLAKAIANALLTPQMAGHLVGSGSLYDKVYNLVPEGLKNMSMDSIREAMQSGSQDAIIEAIKAESSGLLYYASSLIQNAVCKDMYINSTIQNVGQVLALELTYNIYVILTGVIFFIVFRLIIIVLSVIFRARLLRKKKLWERLAGIGMGAIRGFAYACILLMVASYIAGVWPKMQEEVNISKVSVPVTTWVSETTGKLLSGDLEDNDKYKNMIEVLEERSAEENAAEAED